MARWKERDSEIDIFTKRKRGKEKREMILQREKEEKRFDYKSGVLITK